MAVITEIGRMDERTVFRKRLLIAAVVPVFIVGLMWSVFAVDNAFHLGLNRFGLLPRNLVGAFGILSAPLLHSDLDHLFNNSIPMLVLGWCLFFFYPRSAWWALIGTWLTTGVFVWLSARPDVHIGASGVVYALVAFVFWSGLLRRHRQLIALSLFTVFMYGSLVWGVLPIEHRVSFESHLWGGIAGLAFAWVLRKVPSSLPAPPVYFADEVEDGSADAQVAASTDLGDEDDEATYRWRQELAANANRSTTADGVDLRINYPPF
ncbi:MAG: rhomboid family intramembrane serine protease [Flavobacteriales bacterium]|nr:rhomboid family intramembrane serine protease [Flavobacteriales bacterium]